MLIIKSKWNAVTLDGFICNGGLNPLLRNRSHLREVCGNNEEQYAEAARWAAIRLGTYNNWDKSDFSRIESTLEQYFKQRGLVWQSASPICEGCQTIAQVVAKHGGTSSSAKCADFADLLRCVELVGSYNQFSAGVFTERVKRFNRSRFYGEQNPNSGMDLFEYRFAWEGSHAVYIQLSAYSPVRILNDDMTAYRDYSTDEFHADCSWLAESTKADESDLIDGHGDNVSVWRLWWD